MPTGLILLPLLLASITSAALTVAAAMRPPTRMTRTYVVLSAGSTAWIVCWFLGGLAPDLATKWFITNVRVGIAAFLPLGVLALARAIIGERRLSRAAWAALCAPPSISLALGLTSPFHHLLIQSVQVQPTSGLVLVVGGPWFAVQIVYAYSIAVITSLQMGFAAARARAGIRARLWWTLAAPLPSLVGDAAYLVGLTPLPGYSLSPVFAALSGAALFLIMRRHQFQELAPIARRAVVDLIGEIVFVVDEHGDLMDINRAGCQQFGVRRSERIGRPAAGLFPGLDALLTSAIESQQVLADIPLQVNGRTILFEPHVSPIEIEGTQRGRAFVLHDVTVHRRQEQEAREHASRLEDLDRLKDGFVATVSHEIRTPLGSILGLTDVLLDAPLRQEEARHVRSLQYSANLLLTLVNDILDLSKMKSGKLQLNPEPCRPCSLIEEVLESLSPVAERKGLRLNWYCSPALGPLMIDTVRLRQILLNLIGNALKFTEKGGIEVVASRQGELLTLRVTDTGLGIPADKRAMIFDEFTQVDSGTTRQVGGTGLGLPISRRLARIMGGDITVDDAPGGGASFTVTIIAEADTSEASAPSLSPTAGLVLLHAESPLREKMLREVLTAHRYQVETAATMNALLVRARQAPAPMVVWVAASTVKRDFVDELSAAGRSVLLELDRPGDELRDGLPGHTRVLRGPLWSRDIPQLLLGLRPAEPQAARAPASEATPSSEARPTRILLADDVPENRALIAAYVVGQPLQVDYAVDGEEAVAMLRQGDYDVVFLDIEMPRMDGYAAVRAMRRIEHDEARPAVPIVAVTAHGLPEHIAATAAAGFSHHLTRPLGKQAFLRAVETFGGASLRRVEAAEDPAISELRDAYLTKLRDQQVWLADRIAAGDADEIRKFGHQLYGTAGSFGLLELSAIGRGLEVAAETGARGLPELSDAFTRTLDRLKPRPAGSQSGRVLVVEDEPRLRTALTRVLRFEGFEVETAANGREALDSIQSLGIPEMIILDLAMPVMDGREFLAERAGRPRLAEVPVLLVTGADPPTDPLPVAGIIRKPLDSQELMTMVRRVLRPTLEETA